MKVFIGWNGDLSHKVAEALRAWLPMMIGSAEPYLSSEDTHAGTRWYETIARELEVSDYGIFCITRENVANPWMNFEAGALSKAVEKSRVFPFLIDAKPSQITGPLMHFQAATYSYEGALRLAKSINLVAEKPQQDTLIDRHFRRLWEDELKRPIEQAIKEQSASRSAKPQLSAEAMLNELIDLARSQHKMLSDLMAKPEPSGSLNSKVRILRVVDFTDIKYQLRHLRAIVDEAAVPGKPETATMVQIRARIDLITKSLAPALDTE